MVSEPRFEHLALRALYMCYESLIFVYDSVYNEELLSYIFFTKTDNYNRIHMISSLPWYAIDL